MVPWPFPRYKAQENIHKNNVLEIRITNLQMRKESQLTSNCNPPKVSRFLLSLESNNQRTIWVRCLQASQIIHCHHLSLLRQPLIQMVFVIWWTAAPLSARALLQLAPSLSHPWLICHGYYRGSYEKNTHVLRAVTSNSCYCDILLGALRRLRRHFRLQGWHCHRPTSSSCGRSRNQFPILRLYHILGTCPHHA